MDLNRSNTTKKPPVPVPAPQPQEAFGTIIDDAEYVSAAGNQVSNVGNANSGANNNYGTIIDDAEYVQNSAVGSQPAYGTIIGDAEYVPQNGGCGPAYGVGAYGYL